jgi:oligoendopeptidase F
MATAAELADDFGIDLRSPAFWRPGPHMVRRRIDRFSELSSETS